MVSGKQRWKRETPLLGEERASGVEKRRGESTSHYQPATIGPPLLLSERESPYIEVQRRVEQKVMMTAPQQAEPLFLSPSSLLPRRSICRYRREGPAEAEVGGGEEEEPQFPPLLALIVSACGPRFEAMERRNGRTGEKETDGHFSARKKEGRREAIPETEKTGGEGFRVFASLLLLLFRPFLSLSPVSKDPLPCLPASLAALLLG